MKYLTEIGRFQTMIMFLSDKEENGMYLIFVLCVIFILLFIPIKKVICRLSVILIKSYNG